MKREIPLSPFEKDLYGIEHLWVEDELHHHTYEDGIEMSAVDGSGEQPRGTERRQASPFPEEPAGGPRPVNGTRRKKGV